MIGFSDNCYFAEVQKFSPGNIILSKYDDENTSFLRNSSL